MVSDCSENTTKTYGTNMEDTDKNAFDNWLFDKFNLRELPESDVRELMYDAWIAAINYEQNKPMRTYRWDGVIK
jgi:hypothetical protein